MKFEKVDVTDLLERNKFKGGMDSIYIPEIRCAECNSVYSIEKNYMEAGKYEMTLWHTNGCSHHPKDDGREDN